MPAKKPMGRPPKPNPRDLPVVAIVSAKEKYDLRARAAEAGLSVSAYLRRRLGLDGELDGEGE